MIYKLSGGQKIGLGWCVCYFRQPMSALDERPILDVNAVEWLEEFLKTYENVCCHQSRRYSSTHDKSRDRDGRGQAVTIREIIRNISRTRTAREQRTRYENQQAISTRHRNYSRNLEGQKTKQAKCDAHY